MAAEKLLFPLISPLDIKGRQTKWSNLLCRALEMVFKQNMSETIICNHVALINPKEKWINESTQRDLAGLQRIFSSH